MEIISGKMIADEIKAELKELNRQDEINPCLAIVNVGDDKENLLYIGLKENAVVAIGGTTRLINLPNNVQKDEVLEQIYILNNDEQINGILFQLPLPKGLRPYQEDFLEAIDANKDVDGFNPFNRGRLMGDKPGFISCAALACMEVCQRYISTISGKKVLLVGKSFDLIQPLSIMFTRQACQVMVIPDYYPLALDGVDIAVIEHGGPQIVKAQGIKEGALIIDAGFYYDQNNLYGNVDKEAIKGVNGHLLPVPGGMGPILIAKLLENLCQAARAGKDLR